ncbi:hypothetical protein K443DRAFT_355004 [Laccaria amethystina LaAM-08-1]|uniref:Protein kinase domain-containing protein n=1 Tax=Laccaria amethystina LaAM-08-1 TaxID=1095629 RepID=A0A0C9XEJ6_9AGAR|nr:hypothetical protein K443DRAFT_355004 [Laccaria amethystina LaAM-08-1]
MILRQPWSTPVYIWSVGCSTFELLAHTALFHIYESPAATLADVLLRKMTEVIGPFPSQFLEKCKGREAYFDNQGSVLRLETFVPRSLELCLGNYGYNPDDEDIIATADSMRCLTIGKCVGAAEGRAASGCMTRTDEICYVVFYLCPL